MNVPNAFEHRCGCVLLWFLDARLPQSRTAVPQYFVMLQTSMPARMLSECWQSSKLPSTQARNPSAGTAHKWRGQGRQKATCSKDVHSRLPKQGSKSCHFWAVPNWLAGRSELPREVFRTGSICVLNWLAKTSKSGRSELARDFCVLKRGIRFMRQSERASSEHPGCSELART